MEKKLACDVRAGDRIADPLYGLLTVLRVAKMRKAMRGFIQIVAQDSQGRKHAFSKRNDVYIYLALDE